MIIALCILYAHYQQNQAAMRRIADYIGFFIEFGKDASEGKERGRIEAAVLQGG